MSYSNLNPQYYEMFQPQSAWHAGGEGWKDAPWPGWGRNPNLVGPPRLAVDGLGAYYKPEPVKAISGLGACPCSARAQSGYGDAAAPATTTGTGLGVPLLIVSGLALGAILVMVHVGNKS